MFLNQFQDVMDLLNALRSWDEQHHVEQLQHCHMLLDLQMVSSHCKQTQKEVCDAQKWRRFLYFKELSSLPIAGHIMYAKCDQL
jgi:hypothetical protein